MQHQNLKQRFFKIITMSVFCLAVFAFSAKAGGDSYRIFINSKLIMKEFVTHPFNLKNLRMDELNASDNVIIHYSHCGAIGKARSIALKDAKGNTLKEWKFADTKGDEGMVIPVRELLQLERKHSDLTLFYSAKELPEGRLLAGLKGGSKRTT
jgi:hypothetical protein